MNKLTERRTKQFEAANADFRTAFVYFGLAFVHLAKAMKHIFTGLALSFIFITLFSQKTNALSVGPSTATVASGTNWTTPGNTVASDDAWATYQNTTQDYLKLTSFSGLVLY